MLEKIGHIKNPLTVIAMFAGIAEVSGTIVLPFLDVSIQAQYVWFLMGFPCFLVALFFYMLWKKHHVLYAPSDFKEDKSFMEANFNRADVDPLVDLKGEYSVTDSAPPIEACAEELQAVDETPIETQQQESKAEPAQKTAEEPVQDDLKDQAEKHEIEFPHSPKQNALRRIKTHARNLYFLNKDRVLRSLAFRFGGKIQTNVEPKQLPNIKFDAVIESSDICVVSFVDVSNDMFGFSRKVKEKFVEVEKFWSTLAEEDKARFRFHLALMFGPTGLKSSGVKLHDVVAERINLPFKTEVAVYEYTGDSVGTRYLE